MFRERQPIYVWTRRNNLVGKTFAAPCRNHGISCSREAAA